MKGKIDVKKIKRVYYDTIYFLGKVITEALLSLGLVNMSFHAAGLSASLIAWSYDHFGVDEEIL